MSHNKIQPANIQLLNHGNSGSPLQFQLTSSDMFSLLAEALQLAKLLATEDRDMALIRSKHELKTQYLNNVHDEIILYMEKTYRERKHYIKAIKEAAKDLISAKQYDAAQNIMIRMGEIIQLNNPLKNAIELQQRLLHG